jgi:hypothetical protein
MKSHNFSVIFDFKNSFYLRTIYLASLSCSMLFQILKTLLVLIIIRHLPEILDFLIFLEIYIILFSFTIYKLKVSKQ